MNSRSGMRGVALVSVLLIVSVATALAYEMASRHALDVVRARLLFDTSQARQYAFGGEAWARQLLHADWRDEGTRAKDTLLEEWATGAAAPEGARAFEIEQGMLTVRIEDLRARFNLNALASAGAAGPGAAANGVTPNMERFKRLLRHLELDAHIADAWRDWIDADQTVAGHGAEDLDYLSRTPARRAANRAAAHASEFRIAAPLPREEFARLLPHVAVLPQPNLLINVNTATDAVLASLDERLSLADAQRLSMGERDFGSVQEALVEHVKLGENAKELDVRSDFFLVRARAEVGDVVVELTSSLHRHRESGRIRVFARSFGDPFDGSAMARAGKEAA